MSHSEEQALIYLRQERTLRRIGTNADYTPGGNFNIFTITGGPIKITGMFGHVRIACTGAALVPLITFTPTGGGAASAMCTVAVGAAHAINVVLAWDGTLAGVLAPTVGVGHGQAGPASAQGFVAGGIMAIPGIISITNATADATAVIDWYMSFFPLTEAASVTIN
jgi:hypothetical protein